jgi:coproporphyrinogen III oxidase
VGRFGYGFEMLTHPQSREAKEALDLVTNLQSRFVLGLEYVASECGKDVKLEKTLWLRDGGVHGGGSRFSTGDNTVFDRASVNVSQVHYDDLPDKKLGSATAVSTIIHPRNPFAPSMHMHISWTEMKGGGGYWRMMADLNPSNENSEDKAAFLACLRQVAPDQYDEAIAQGDRYFYIPALNRHRGVAHFYLENYKTDDDSDDARLAQALGEEVIDCYLTVLKKAVAENLEGSDAARAAQLAYHTLYFFQVLTLDRGTTSGLLVHDQNDIGIMGSLPSHVDKQLLASWREKLPSPQGQLLDGLLACLPDSNTNHVDSAVKRAVAQVVREHYKKNPEALALQASGNVIPPTVQNHR